MSLRKAAKDFLFLINKNPVSRFLYEREISKRAKMPLTDILSLSKHIQVFSPFTTEINPSNDWYGHAKHFKKYLNLPLDYQFKFVIEHGFFPSEQISQPELEPNFESYITSNKHRLRVVKKIKKHVFNIGPFIHYVDHYLSKDKILEEKKRLGKNILVFPAHSFSYIIVNYNSKWFREKIKKISKNFDSVRICLFWADISLGLHQYYQSLGFECVTAGHILDPNFLPRLKSLIEISDLTVSNDIGTHTGYSIYMNKPNIVFYKKPAGLKGSKKWKDLQKEHWASKPYRDLLEIFSQNRFKITPKQRQLADLYFGGKEDIKSRKAFQKIVDLTEKYY